MIRWAHLQTRVARLAEHPQARGWLVAVAFVEASVFPIPPDVMLLPMALAAPRRALLLAALATAGSVAGALVGYAIGAFFFDAVARPLIAFYHMETGWRTASEAFARHGAWFVALAAISPIPFKAATIAAGALAMPPVPFLVACALGRGARFFVEALLAAAWGPTFLAWLRRHAEIASALAAFAAALLLILLWAWAGD